MSTLQETILQEADGITTETRVCGITQERVGGLFTKIGTELGNLENSAQAKAITAKEEAIASAKTYTNTARGEAVSIAKTYTDLRETDIRSFVGTIEAGLHNITESLTTTKADKTEVALKANSTTTMVELPSTGANIPDSYLKRIGTWRANTADGSVRGRWLSLGDATEQFQLHFSYPTGQAMKIEAQGCSTNSCLSPVTIFHSGNFDPSEYVELSNCMEVYSAGKISDDGSTPTLYKGASVTTEKMTTGRYRVTHNLGNTNYMVNITPIGSVARSFAISTKDTACFEVQFDLEADFEFQILKY